MVRPAAADRLDTIVSAALTRFAEQGYRRARMSDVAAAAGVSPGLLYTYAVDKEALFTLVLRREAGVDISGLDLPAARPDDRELARIVGLALADLGALHSLDDAEANDAPNDAAAEIAAIVGELFDAVFRYRSLLRLIERCAADWPSLARVFYDDGRRTHLDRLARFLQRRRDAGLLPALGDPDITARFVMETVAWFADHRFGDYDGARLDDTLVRTEVVALVTRALVGS